MGDAELLAQFVGNAEVTADYMLARFHLATGFYQVQFQVKLLVPSLTIAGDAAAISSSTAPITLLNEFSLWGNVRYSGATDVALAYLYTARAMDGGTLGIARINALCGSSRFGLSKSLEPWPFAMASITAHELGHTFAMLHDTGCNDSPESQFLMCPYTTQSSPRLSAASRHTALGAIGVAVDSGCFVPL